MQCGLIPVIALRTNVFALVARHVLLVMPSLEYLLPQGRTASCKCWRLLPRRIYHPVKLLHWLLSSYD